MSNVSKRSGILIGMLAMVILPLLTVLNSFAAGPNLIANPSAETAGTPTSVPANWTQGGWGTNNSTYTWRTDGKDGARSLGINVASYSNGDAKWMSSPVTLKPNTQYKLSDWYISNVATSLELSYTSTTGAVSYAWLGDVTASNTWKEASATFTTPANVKTATFYHLISRVGSLQTDAYYLEDLSTPPTGTPPTVSITTPVNNATVSGTQTVSANASDSTGVAGVQFKVDGNNIGAEDTTAPYSASLNSTTLTNGSHSISAVARNTGGLTATATATVTVNNTTTPPPTGTNFIVNPSVETAANATTPASWSSNKWGTNTTQFSYLTTGHTGSRSVKVTTSGYVNGDAKWSFANVPVTPGKAYLFSNWYQSTADTELNAAVTMTNNSIQYFSLGTVPVSSTWKQSKAIFTAPTNAKSVTIYQALAKNGNVTTDDYSLTEYIPQGFNQGLVSITLDDGWRNQHTNAAPALDARNMDATFYLLTNTVTFPDYMTVAQMQSLKDRGHELDSHTISHPHLTQLSAANLTNELAGSQSQLRTWFGAAGVADDFASPYGEYNSNVLTEIKKYYRSHRSTDVGFNTKDTIDIYNIKVQNILSSTTAAQVNTWVQQAKNDKSWLVLVYHEVGSPLQDPTYGTSTTMFTSHLNAIQAAGIPVRTVGQAIAELVPQL